MHSAFNSTTRYYTISTQHASNSDEILQIFGHPRQLRGCVLLETELKQSIPGWYHPDFTEDDEPENWKEIKRQATPGAKQWRVLLELNPGSSSFMELSNFKGEFNQDMYYETFYLMIKQEDMDTMNFRAAEFISQST